MNIGSVSTWTIARVEQLKALLLEGYSSSQIAFKLGDTTRNSVIGKIFRLKLSRVGIVKKEAPRAPRQSPPKSQPRQRYTPESKRFTTVFNNVEHLNLRCAMIEPMGISLFDIEPHQCRWPYGDSDFTFCGHDKHKYLNTNSDEAESSYCIHHFALSKRRMTI